MESGSILIKKKTDMDTNTGGELESIVLITGKSMTMP